MPSVQIQVDLLSIIVALVGLIALFVRTEIKVRQNEKDLIEYKADQKLRFAEFKAEHEAKEKAVWEKFDKMQSTLENMIGTLGRVEGKIDAKG